MTIDWEDLANAYSAKSQPAIDVKGMLHTLYHQYGSTRQVGRVLGVSYAATARMMNKCGIPRMTKADQIIRPALRVAGIPKCKRDKMTIKQIAIAANCSRTAVDNYLENEKERRFEK